jgi:hypothetical protein
MARFAVWDWVRVHSPGEPDHDCDGLVVRVSYPTGHDYGVLIEGQVHTRGFNDGELRPLKVTIRKRVG